MNQLVISAEEQPKAYWNLLQMIIKKNPLTSLFVYSSKPDYKLAGSLMHIGVKGYLTRSGCPDEIVRCLRSVLAGERYVHHSNQAA